MEEDLLIATEAQSVVGLCRKQEAIACGGVCGHKRPLKGPTVGSKGACAEEYFVSYSSEERNRRQGGA